MKEVDYRSQSHSPAGNNVCSHDEVAPEGSAIYCSACNTVYIRGRITSILAVLLNYVFMKKIRNLYTLNQRAETYDDEAAGPSDVHLGHSAGDDSGDIGGQHEHNEL